MSEWSTACNICNEFSSASTLQIISKPSKKSQHTLLCFPLTMTSSRQSVNLSVMCNFVCWRAGGGATDQPVWRRRRRLWAQLAHRQTHKSKDRKLLALRVKIYIILMVWGVVFGRWHSDGALTAAGQGHVLWRRRHDAAVHRGSASLQEKNLPRLCPRHDVSHILIHSRNAHYFKL